ncbi:MAG: exodeoxyribonuclease VII large subunit, partial [Alphaproteobacteria bacterium]|nr:exodeoxyribonuclease VII large subunit [Alphaproteobacteria bacterium]
VIWKGVFGRMRFRPEEGLEVIATGKVTSYPLKSSYQIVIDSMEPAGVGALLAQLDERRRRLEAEGLFDPARKQLLPFLPQIIGVVTSPTGAVIRDILHRLDDRFPRQVIVWPVRVQGEGSAEEIARAIEGFNALPEGGAIPKPDLLIVARGGGSLEDLWSFNEEIVVRAAANSMIPLIAAVGHETDTTLIDFAADRRAPTPTGAAEMAVPVRIDLLTQTHDLGRRNALSARRLLDRRKTDLRAAFRALPAPDALVAIPRQRLDLASERLGRGLERNAARHRARLTDLSRRLLKLSPQARLSGYRAHIGGLQGRLGAARGALLRAEQQRLTREREKLIELSARARKGLDRIFERKRTRLLGLTPLLKSLSYQGVLERGFALVLDAKGAPIRAAKAIKPGDELALRFADGTIDAIAKSKSKA